MDLIDRQEAIKALEKAGEVNYIATGDFHGIINALNVIKGLPNANPTLTQHSPKWISCSERLPEVNGDYLVTGRKGAVNKRKFEDGRWYGNWAVLAWMPLPERYGGDEE